MERRHTSVNDEKPEKTEEEARRERLDLSLEDALENTFPASDPISVVQPSPKPTDKPHSRQGK